MSILIVMAAAKSRLSVRFSDQNDSGTTRASGTSRILTHSKGRKRIAEDDDDDSPPLQKRKKFKSKKFVESDEDDVQSHPVPNKGKARMLQDPEVLEVEKVSLGVRGRFNTGDIPHRYATGAKPVARNASGLPKLKVATNELVPHASR